LLPFSSTAFGYRDRLQTPTGLDVLRVRSGNAGEASVAVKGKAAHLTLPALPLALPTRVQLRASNGTCWETSFSATGVRRNDGTRFKGTAD
jgi:hypothetical protein